MVMEDVDNWRNWVKDMYKFFVPILQHFEVWNYFEKLFKVLVLGIQ